MDNLKLKDILTTEQLIKINSVAYDLTVHCENNDVTPLEFVYVLLHLLTSIKEADEELNTGLGLIIDLYTGY